MANIVTSVEQGLAKFARTLASFTKEDWLAYGSIAVISIAGVLIMTAGSAPRRPKALEYWVGSRRFGSFEDASSHALARAMERGETVELVLYGPHDEESVFIDAVVR